MKKGNTAKKALPYFFCEKQQVMRCMEYTQKLYTNR